MCSGSYETVYGTTCWKDSIGDLIGYSKANAKYICRKCAEINNGCQIELEEDDRVVVKLKVHPDD
jgi:hypothetical protein